MIKSISGITESLFLVPFLLLYFLLTLFVSGNAFFWDTVQLGSLQAHWYYDNNFSFFFLPDRIDSGHPPLFGIYLAVLWKLFGRTLDVSHFAMLPFLWGIVIQFYLLLKKFFKREHCLVMMLLLLADPTLLAQSILVSPDIILIFFLFLSLNAILSGNRWLLAISLIFLGLISMRGMMHIAILYLVSVVVQKERITLKRLIIQSLPFIPSVLLVSLFLFSHHLEKGWIGYHEDSPWRDSFQLVDFKGFMRNAGIFGWRVLDFGRIIIWIIGIPVLWISFRKKLWDKKAVILAALVVFSVVILTPNMLIHSNLLGHRYLLIIYLSFALLCFYFLSVLKPEIFKKITFLAIAVLLSGNFLRYPEGIAQGWDASLAHYPYYQMRLEMKQYVKENDIPLEETGTGFPNTSSFRYIDLSEDSVRFSRKDLEKNNYVLYSNVFNEFSDQEIEELKKWKVLKKIESSTVSFTLYSKK